MADKKNVIVGAARVWIGTADATLPSFEANKSFNVTLAGDSDWRDVGYTQEGVEYSSEPEYGEIQVDQALDSVRMHKSSVRNTLNTTFAEATLENLLVVWGQQDSTLSTVSGNEQMVITAGGLGEAPIERQVVLVGNGKESTINGWYNERIYHLERAIVTESSSHAMRRDEGTVFPVSFRLMPSDRTGAPYGVIIERERTSTWIDG